MAKSHLDHRKDNDARSCPERNISTGWPNTLRGCGGPSPPYDAARARSAGTAAAPGFRPSGTERLGRDGSWSSTCWDHWRSSERTGFVTPSRLKERVLLALLLVNAGQAVSAAEITDTLWGSTPPASAQANLYSYVASIRRGLQSGSAPGAARVRTAGAGYLLDAAPAEIDALRFERLTGDGTRLLHDNRPVDAVLRLEAALQLWRGRALMDLTTTPDIFKLEIARLDDLRLVALEHLTEARIEAGQADQAAVEAAALAQGHPTRERLWYLLMLARFRAGRQAEALAAYQQAYRALERELGLRPGDQLRELQQRILAGIPDTASKQTRLTPPDGDRPHQPLTSAALLVGRDRELELLTTWHAAATGPTFTGLPLLAVTGPPGVGKTALAVHWARSVSDCYPDGQILIDLRGYSTQAPTSTHEALTQLLVSLGVNTNDIPSEAHAATALYRSSISQRRVLIILDNAAHASPGAVARHARHARAGYQSQPALRPGCRRYRHSLVDRRVDDARVDRHPRWNRRPAPDRGKQRRGS